MRTIAEPFFGEARSTYRDQDLVRRFGPHRGRRVAGVRLGQDVHRLLQTDADRLHPHDEHLGRQGRAPARHLQRARGYDRYAYREAPMDVLGRQDPPRHRWQVPHVRRPLAPRQWHGRLGELRHHPCRRYGAPRALRGPRVCIQQRTRQHRRAQGSQRHGERASRWDLLPDCQRDRSFHDLHSHLARRALDESRARADRHQRGFHQYSAAGRPALGIERQLRGLPGPYKVQQPTTTYASGQTPPSNLATVYPNRPKHLSPLAPQTPESVYVYAEDPIIWYSGGQFHVIYDYPDDRVAYHLTSPDGIHGWTDQGLAFDPRDSAKLFTNSDGSVGHWYNVERPNVIMENGHVSYFTFAVSLSMVNFQVFA